MLQRQNLVHQLNYVACLVYIHVVWHLEAVVVHEAWVVQVGQTAKAKQLVPVELTPR